MAEEQFDAKTLPPRQEYAVPLARPFLSTTATWLSKLRAPHSRQATHLDPPSSASLKCADLEPDKSRPDRRGRRRDTSDDLQLGCVAANAPVLASAAPASSRPGEAEVVFDDDRLPLLNGPSSVASARVEYPAGVRAGVWPADARDMAKEVSALAGVYT